MPKTTPAGELDKTVGEELRAAREAARVSRRTVSERIGMHETGVRLREEGMRPWRLGEMQDYVRAIGASLDVSVTCCIDSVDVDQRWRPWTSIPEIRGDEQDADRSRGD